MIELDAFADDCRVLGWVEPGDGRLTDLLNDEPELRILEARLVSHLDGHETEAPELVVDRDELFAVVATGSRGAPARRLHTHASKVLAELGPYRVTGSIHGTAASNPLAGVFRRAPWLPLTEATITYVSGGGEVSESYETLLINRALASWIRPAIEEAPPLLPWESQDAHLEAQTGALDLTSSLHDEIDGDAD